MRTSLKVDAAKLDVITRTPFPNSTKVYEAGRTFPELRVPTRQISLTDTKHADGRITHNPALTLYDTTGPYTDAAARNRSQARQNIDSASRT